MVDQVVDDIQIEHILGNRRHYGVYQKPPCEKQAERRC